MSDPSPPRPNKAFSLSRDDAIFWIGVAVLGDGLYLMAEHPAYGIPLILVGIAALWWTNRGHMPKPQWRMALLILAMAITCGISGYDLYERHFMASPQTVAQQSPAKSDEPASLSEADARLDAIDFHKGVARDGGNYVTNISAINRGKAPVNLWQMTGSMPIANDILNRETVDNVFTSLRTQVAAAPQKSSEGETYPGQGFFFTVEGLPADEKTTALLTEGKKLLYVFSVMRYRDPTLPKDKFIYTEICAFFKRDLLNYCQYGHNKSYVAP